MAETTLYWHDYETSGIDPRSDRPLQFAGVRTDEALNVIDEPMMIYARPAEDLLPNPEAMLVTGISPNTLLEKGLRESEFIARIHEELGRPGTCGVGYNSIRFDDEFTRNTLYRNLYDPYAREWQNGNSRWDIIDLVRAAHDLRPEGIEWPKNDNGRTSFRLELLTEANGLGHEQAHDALSDVYATIAMARLIRDKQPRLYEYAWGLRKKHEVAKLLNLRERKPVLHTTRMFSSDHGATRVVVPVAAHPSNRNSVIIADLTRDPTPLLELDAERIRELLYTRGEDLPEGVERPGLKQVMLNRSPMVAPLGTLTDEAAERLQIDLAQCERHHAMLMAAEGLEQKLAEVFAPGEGSPESDPDRMIYSGGFFSDADKRRMDEIHRLDPSELADYPDLFDDERLPEMLFRYRARNYPETLNRDEREQWLALRRERLTDPAAGNLTFGAYFSRIEQLLTEETVPQRRALLEELKHYGHSLQDRLVLD